MGQQQNEEISQRFGERLRLARGDKTREEFAKFLGLGSHQTLENYEKGRIPMPLILARIASKLQLTMEQLLFGKYPDVVPDSDTMRLKDEAGDATTSPTDSRLLELMGERISLTALGSVANDAVLCGWDDLLPRIHHLIEKRRSSSSGNPITASLDELDKTK